MRIDRNRSCLVIVDMQERLLPAMTDAEATVGRAATLMRAADRLGVPILVSEQYPRGLGASVPEIGAAESGAQVIEKVHFACTDEPGFAAAVEATERDQAVVAGVEAHVCVLQTALALLERGTSVFVVADAVSSRNPADREAALQRLRPAGAVVATTEMVIFEWLERAGTPEFKDVQALIK